MAGLNSDWEQDIQESVAEYNDWYLRYTVEAYRRARVEASQLVEKTLTVTDNLRNLEFRTLWSHPEIIRGLRMTSSPTWAVDRLIGISAAPPALVRAMENNRTGSTKAETAPPLIEKIIATIKAGCDPNLLPWLDRTEPPTQPELERAKTLMIDRLALSIANPDIRNAQEFRQLDVLKTWLAERGYEPDEDTERPYDEMKAGTYRVHMNARGKREDGSSVRVSVDMAIMPLAAQTGDLPIMLECKSAGDFTNVNKRRKEEADKHANLVREHGESLQYALYLSGYFDTNYLEYERAAGIAWVWHHRINDLDILGL